MSDITPKLHEAIQAAVADDDNLHGSVLLGWVLVAEWMDGDSDRWLTRFGAPADPTRTLPDWQGDGYLHNALQLGGWDVSIDITHEDDDDE